MTKTATPTWLIASRQKLADLARTIEDWTPKTLYGALAGMTLLPLAATSDDPRTVLAGIVGGIGADLIANQLEAWKARDDENERTLATQLTENARTDDELRDALDTLLEKVDALQTLVEHLPEEERATTLQLLEAQFKKLGSRLSVTGDHNITIGGNATNNTLITGANNPITQYHFHNVAESFVRTLTAKPLADAALQQATERYLQLLWNKHSILDIKGIGMADRVSLNLPLLAMYVPLKARIELPEGETWSRSLKLAGRAVSEEERFAIGERLSVPLPLLDLLAEHAGLVILGDPGAGKTTFLKHLALGLALDQPPLPALAHRLPILIPLAAYANELAQRDCSLQEFLGDYYRRQGIEDLPVADLLRSALSSGRALLLFDGLDEVQERGQRARIVNRVETFFAHHRQSGNKFVLTSRIVGYRDAPLSAPGVQTCTLVDFDAEDQSAFVDKWSVVLEEAIRGKNPEAGKAAAAEKAELLDALHHNPGVQQLAANPLLLTILALMKRQGVLLPERRVQLYEQYVKTLLSTWNVARGLDRHQSSRQLDYVETLKILAPLALWMQESSPGKGLVKEAALQHQLETIYRQRGEPDPARAAAHLLKDARDYASLLLERGPGEYGFIHLTFMEYLAAVGAANLAQQEVTPLVKRLAAHLDQSEWHEVILLTIGVLGIVQGRDGAAGDAVQGLINSGQGEPGRAIVLAGEAVADAWPGGVTPACQQAVVQELVKTLRNDKVIKPVLRAHAGRALARLGDPRPEVMTIEGMEFCYVPPGPFIMGSGDDDPLAYDSEKPQHIYDITYGYWIGRYLVTNAQFKQFVTSGGYSDQKWWSEAKEVGFWKAGQVQNVIYRRDEQDKLVREFLNWRDCPAGDIHPYSLPNHPILGISWYEALAFTRWLTFYLRDNKFIPRNWIVTLPNEPEWEKAGRGGLELPQRRQMQILSKSQVQVLAVQKTRKNINPARRYPWGNKINSNYANCKETEIENTNTVGIFPQGSSVYGVEELSGNCWEWTRSLAGTDRRHREFTYPYLSHDGRERLNAGIDVHRVLRGGAYFSACYLLRLTTHNLYEPNVNGGAFRVVVSPPTFEI
ncbi:MAG: NACHT domain-containing protein [Caldilinea sp. CFX5]|nr:NACHT domain-containing protein [Caldilinea sp. CFX5]